MFRKLLVSFSVHLSKSSNYWNVVIMCSVAFCYKMMEEFRLFTSDELQAAL